MTIEKVGDSGFMITGKEDIDLYFLTAAYHRMGMEIDHGMRWPGPAITTQLKKRYGWRGSKASLREQLGAEIERRKAERE